MDFTLSTLIQTISALLRKNRGLSRAFQNQLETTFPFPSPNICGGSKRQREAERNDQGAWALLPAVSRVATSLERCWWSLQSHSPHRSFHPAAHEGGPQTGPTKATAGGRTEAALPPCSEDTCLLPLSIKSVPHGLPPRP